jgi:hypothetical protein
MHVLKFRVNFLLNAGFEVRTETLLIISAIFQPSHYQMDVVADLIFKHSDRAKKTWSTPYL